MTERAPLRVVLADDQELVRLGLRMVLSRAPGIAVVGEACDGHEAVAAVRKLRPDIVLMDIQMPRLDGLEACTHIVKDPTLSTKVVVLTTFDFDDNVFRALANGASAFLLKDHPAYPGTPRLYLLYYLCYPLILHYHPSHVLQHIYHQIHPNQYRPQWQQLHPILRLFFHLS